eukprot:scaffold1883_cov108-Isochrysis_galbana.AAC.1
MLQSHHPPCTACSSPIPPLAQHAPVPSPPLHSMLQSHPRVWWRRVGAKYSWAADLCLGTHARPRGCTRPSPPHPPTSPSSPASLTPSAPPAPQAQRGPDPRPLRTACGWRRFHPALGSRVGFLPRLRRRRRLRGQDRRARARHGARGVGNAQEKPRSSLGVGNAQEKPASK